MKEDGIGGRCRTLGEMRNVYNILFEDLDFILSSHLKRTRRMTEAPEIHVFSGTFIPKCY